MITFIIALVILLGGYFLYGKLTERAFCPDDRPTPAVEHPDGVDYVPMKTVIRRAKSKNAKPRYAKSQNFPKKVL